MSELREALQLAAARPEIQQMQMAFPQPLSEKYRAHGCLWDHQERVKQRWHSQ